MATNPREMDKCCVPQCNRFGENNFYSFPEDSELCKGWINAIKSGHKDCKHSDWIKLPWSKVCTNHFRKEDFRTLQIDGTEVRTYELKPDALPTNHVVCKKMSHKKILATPSYDCEFDNLWHDYASGTPLESADEFIFDTDDNLLSTNVQLKCEVNKLTDEHVELKKKMNASFLDKNTVTDDNCLRDLTGVPSDYSFKTLLSVVTPALSLKLSKIPISLETQLMLVMMKLKLGLPDMMMCIVYGLELHDLHEVFTLWIETLISALIPLIKPQSTSTDILQQPPVLFADFVQVTSEASLTPRPSRTYRELSAKSENLRTVKKVLVLLRPTGFVPYVSEPLPLDTLAFAALRSIPNLNALLLDVDKISIVSSQEIITKKDLELGVMLEPDESSTETSIVPEYKPFLMHARAIMTNLQDFAVLKGGFDSPFNRFSSSMVKICAVITSARNQFITPK